MTDTEHKRIRELLDRLGRIMSADEWGDQINPTQLSALSYLAEANQYSRSPSQVAEYMSSTRGTVSQTLKALARKGFIEETRSAQDKRSISYSVTDSGQAVLMALNPVETLAAELTGAERGHLLEGLEALLRKTLKSRSFKTFGVCKTCIHHEQDASGPYCQLLKIPLSNAEADQVCHEHTEPQLNEC